MPPPPSSFTVEFLTSACGLHLPSAVSTARTLTLTPSSVHNGSSMLSLIKSHRFSPAEISALVSARPSLLLSHPSLLSPKLHLLLSLHRLPSSLISANLQILSRSLANHIQLTMELLHTFLGGSSPLLFSALRRFGRLLTSSPATALAPNLALHLSLRVPHLHIAKLLSTHPRALLTPVPCFSRAVSAVSRLGVHPETLLFVHAVCAIAGVHQQTFESRIKLLKSFGWEEEDIMAAFRLVHLFVLVSEDKMKRMVYYLTNVVGLGSKEMSRQLKLMMYGLEKWVAPRFAVFQALLHCRSHALLTRPLAPRVLLLSRPPPASVRLLCRPPPEHALLLSMFTS